ncbi:anaerobic ribonucleoside triphosphate reductase [bacterium BMS3Abin15]|nr:anaerobic ribonucleoside triphosphate reductase [bacterium BMS3Abin15]HDH07415.1 hypothetical protein [Candidatus Moranbacteria bacterium]HDZ85943.1 hypothetical protein [Candidatus Moranbacteria bacterium]
MKKYTCHDCGRTLQHDEEYMPYKVDSETYVKCKSCHQKNPVLKSFRKTEIYSRVVGYIRPVEQWNEGKQEEYKDRKEYVADSGCH